MTIENLQQSLMDMSDELPVLDKFSEEVESYFVSMGYPKCNKKRVNWAEKLLLGMNSPKRVSQFV